MLKVACAVFGFAVAASAAAGWRDMPVDASSEGAFKESVELLQERMPAPHRETFAWVLQRLWVNGSERAQLAEREFTADDYFRQLHGLDYKALRKRADPTGKQVRAFYVAAVTRHVTPIRQFAHTTQPPSGFTTFMPGGGVMLDAANAMNGQYTGNNR